MPPETPQRATAFQVEGVSTPGENPERGYFLAVTPNYFGALGARLVAGREFDSHDLAGGEPVVIINDSLARRLFPDGKAVGKRVKLSDQEQTPEWRSIVGVVGDIKYSGLDDPAQASIYTPFAQTPFLWAYVFVRTVGNEARVAGAIRTEVAAVDSRLTAARIRPMQQVVAGSVAQPRFNMVLLSAFGLLALLLSSVGIYGVISYAVVLRTHEIGVRMALGAGPGDIARLLVAQGLRLTSIGIVIGLAGAFALTRVMQGMLFGISSSDPVTFATISLLLSTVAAIASYIPARRATAVDPLVALRHE
jgi:putative ABC transport system permease protein